MMKRFSKLVTLLFALGCFVALSACQDSSSNLTSTETTDVWQDLQAPSLDWWNVLEEGTTEEGATTATRSSKYVTYEAENGEALLYTLDYSTHKPMFLDRSDSGSTLAIVTMYYPLSYDIPVSNFGCAEIGGAPGGITKKWYTSGSYQYVQCYTYGSPGAEVVMYVN